MNDSTVCESITLYEGGNRKTDRRATVSEKILFPQAAVYLMKCSSVCQHATFFLIFNFMSS